MEKTERFHGLDLARSVLMILGIFYHTSLAFTTTPKWRIHSGAGHSFFDISTSLTHDFRLHSFYFISGFFIALSLSRNPVNTVIKKRIVRLIIPLFFAGIIINHTTHFILFEEFDLQAYITRLITFRWTWHLWFLGNLIVYIAISPFLFFFTRNLKLNHFPFWLSGILVFGGFCLFSFVFPIVAGRIYFGDFLFISFGPLYQFLGYFLLGMILYTEKNLFRLFTSSKITIPSLVLTIIAIHLLNKTTLPSFDWHIKMLLEQSYHLWLSMLLIGLFNKLTKPSKLVQMISRSSYTIYVLHQPMILFLLTTCFTLQIPNIVSYLSCILIVFFSCLLFHQKIVDKNRVIAFLLNGRNLEIK